MLSPTTNAGEFMEGYLSCLLSDNGMDLHKPAHSKIFVLHIFRQLIIRVSTVQILNANDSRINIMFIINRLVFYFYFFVIPDYGFPIFFSGKRFTKLRPP